MRTRTYTTLIEKHIVAFRAASMRVSNIDDPIAFPDPCKEAEHSSGSRTERPEEAGSDGADACDAIDNDRIARENRLRVHLGGAFVDIHPHQCVGEAAENDQRDERNDERFYGSDLAENEREHDQKTHSHRKSIARYPTGEPTCFLEAGLRCAAEHHAFVADHHARCDER